MKIVTVVGARPQFIKAAPVSRAIEGYNKQGVSGASSILEVLVHTGQHYDDNMSQVFFRELELRNPEYNLGVGSGSHGDQTGEMLKRIEGVLVKERPDYVLVYGDTNSTLAGALAAVKLHIPVAHVEAGLRSYNKQMPEEINRVLTDHVSTLLFCPTETSMKNLAREGITQGANFLGDVMYDALLYNIKIAEKRSTILETLGLRTAHSSGTMPYYLATVHRAENTDDPERLRAIIEAFQEISLTHPVIWPIHPRTQQALKLYRPLSITKCSLRMIDPLSYLDMLILEKNAEAILTDSGGVQKESCWFQVPCITLRDETEWVETVISGWNILVGANTKKIIQCALSLAMPQPVPPFYEKGRTAQSILEVLTASGRKSGVSSADEQNI